MTPHTLMSLLTSKAGNDGHELLLDRGQGSAQVK